MKINVLFSIYFSAISLLLCSVFGAFQYFSAKTQYNENLQKRLVDIAATVSGTLDVEGHATLTKVEDEQTYTYKRIKESFHKSIQANPDIRFLYSMRKGPDGTVLFVVDGEMDPAAMSHVGDVYAEASDMVKSSLSSLAKGMADPEPYQDKWGTFQSGYAPIIRADGTQDGIIGVDVSVGKIKEAMDGLLLRTILLSLFLSLLGAGLGFFLAKRIVDPVQISIGHLTSMTEFDLSRDLPPHLLNRTDEIGQLLNSTQSLGETLRKMVGDLSQGVETIKNSTEKFATNSAQIQVESDKSSTQTSKVTRSSRQIDSSIREISGSTAAMSDKVLTIAAAVEELTSTTREISKNCSEESEAAKQADKQANDAKVVMENLSDSAQKISSVIDTITDIAEQTNLLALNASIEAATAGAAGKGFAVVASEVKTLAAQVSVAAEEIANHIDAMQVQTRHAIDAIRSTTTGIDRVNTLSMTVVSSVDEQSKTIQEIATTISGTSFAAKAIAKDLGYASNNLNDVTQSIAGIEVATGSAARGNQAMSATSAELSKLADELAQMVSKFKV
jgi:methyl-accepting chemotaxis protein